MTETIFGAKVVFIIALVIVLFELFMWAQKFLERPITWAYALKSLVWAVILSVPFFIWFFC
jgi:hypothetical protein